ncbi:aminoglycoside phosphotransferase family protein [Halosimplex amylolyticum]|uniref:aminoglycoside phosphotransferase family protein n=1 Tax=Halosimplex amylolyticum TaxID=3396616 RepID=UPI003F57712F
MTDGSVSPADARGAVADAVPDERVETVRRMEDGTNAVYRVETDADAYVVKYSTFSGRELLAAEVEVYRLLADTDLPVPRVVDATLDRADGPAFVVMEALPGSSPDGDAVTPAVAREMGATLRGFASVPPLGGYGRLRRDPDRTPPLVAREDSWREYVDWYADMLLSKPSDALADCADDVRAVIDETRPAVPAEPDPALVVSDYRPSNLHVDGDGRVVGVFDLERAAVGDLRFALVNAAYLLTRHRPAEAEQLRAALFDGFGDAVGGEVRTCYRAVAVAREIRGFDFWWDDRSVVDEEAANVRAFVKELTE